MEPGTGLEPVRPVLAAVEAGRPGEVTIKAKAVGITRRVSFGTTFTILWITLDYHSNI